MLAERKVTKNYNYFAKFIPPLKVRVFFGI
jgi:hypothetical protein